SAKTCSRRASSLGLRAGWARLEACSASMRALLCSIQAASAAIRRHPHFMYRTWAMLGAPGDQAIWVGSCAVLSALGSVGSAEALLRSIRLAARLVASLGHWLAAEM